MSLVSLPLPLYSLSLCLIAPLPSHPLSLFSSHLSLFSFCQRLKTYSAVHKDGEKYGGKIVDWPDGTLVNDSPRALVNFSTFFLSSSFRAQSSNRWSYQHSRSSGSICGVSKEEWELYITGEPAMEGYQLKVPSTKLMQDISINVSLRK